MEYNTGREHLILREYGRNVQKIVEHIKSIDDKDKRTEYAHAVVHLMQQITPENKDQHENIQKVWDDLYIISGFKLDVDCPYPQPDSDVIWKKPRRVPYQNNRIRYKHYGRNIELLIEEAIKKEDPKEKEDSIIYIGKLMKSFYLSWNKDVVDDIVILDHIKVISKGQLVIDLDKVRDGNLFEKLYKNKKKPVRPNKPTGGRKNMSNRRRKSN